MAAASHLMEAVKELRRMPKTGERRLKLEFRLRKAQSSMPEQMGTMSRPIDLAELQGDARDCVGGVSLSQALEAFAQLQSSRSPDELRNEARKQVQESLFSSIMPRTLLDHEGKLVSRSPALDGHEETEDVALHRRIAQSESLHRQLVAFGLMEPARQPIHAEHRLDQRDSLPLVAMTPFVPGDREHLFSLALARSSGGDCSSALHILVLQLENSLRKVLKQAGHEPSSIGSDMTQENRSLSVMLERDRDSLEEIYCPAIVFEVENLFDSQGGLALSHNVAHGLVSDEMCHGAHAIQACWFIFRLCCLHVFGRWDELTEWMDGQKDSECGAAPPGSAEAASEAADPNPSST